MGVIAAVTPVIKIEPITPTHDVADSDIKNRAKVGITEYGLARHLLTGITFHELPSPTCSINRLDVMWHCLCFLKEFITCIIAILKYIAYKFLFKTFLVYVNVFPLKHPFSRSK